MEARVSNILLSI